MQFSHMRVTNVIDHAAAFHPDSGVTSVPAEGGRVYVSYRELRERALTLAYALKEEGVKCVVVIPVPRSRPLIARVCDPPAARGVRCRRAESLGGSSEIADGTQRGRGRGGLWGAAEERAIIGSRSRARRRGRRRRPPALTHHAGAPRQSFPHLPAAIEPDRKSVV